MSNRWLIAALALSLAVNLFIVGAVVGALGQRARFDPQRGGPGGNPLMAAGDQLPEDLRAAYREQIRAESLAARPLLAQARQARLEAGRYLAAADYDPEAAAAALARAREAEVAARARLEGVVVEFAEDLRPAQRRILSRALRQPPGAARGRGGRGPGPGPGPMGPPPEGPPPPPPQ